MRRKPTLRRPGASLGIAVLLLLGLLTSCSNETDQSALDVVPSREELDAQAAEAAAEAEAAEAAENEPVEVEPEEPESEFETLGVIWEQLFDAAGLPADQRREALEGIETLDPDVIDAAVASLRPFETGDAYTYPTYEKQADGTIRIEDCTLYQPAVWESVTHLHIGIAEQNQDGGWTITELGRDTTQCVPAQIALPALDGYNNYVQALRDYWNPPNPNHPGIQQTLTAEMLESTPGRLQESLDAGEYLVADDEIAPEIVRVYAPDWLIIADCRITGDDAGLFESNGELVEGVQQPIPGSRVRREVDMRLDDGTWKTADVLSVIIGDCQQAPTAAGLRIIQ